MQQTNARWAIPAAITMLICLLGTSSGQFFDVSGHSEKTKEPNLFLCNLGSLKDCPSPPPPVASPPPPPSPSPPPVTEEEPAPSPTPLTPAPAPEPSESSELVPSPVPGPATDLAPVPAPVPGPGPGPDTSCPAVPEQIATGTIPGLGINLGLTLNLDSTLGQVFRINVDICLEATVSLESFTISIENVALQFNYLAEIFAFDVTSRNVIGTALASVPVTYTGGTTLGAILPTPVSLNPSTTYVALVTTAGLNPNILTPTTLTVNTAPIDAVGRLGIVSQDSLLPTNILSGPLELDTTANLVSSLTFV